MSISLNTLEAYGMSVKTILAEMEENFPPTNPGPNDTIETIMYRSGQRSVVEWLLNKLEQDGI